MSDLTRRQKERLLDKEIATALKRKTPKRPLGRDARNAIAAAILEDVPLNHAARSAIDVARDTAVDAEYKRALKQLEAELPKTLWVGYDAARHQGFAQAAEPIWIADDPQGEDPSQWRQIDRAEIARILVEDSV